MEHVLLQGQDLSTILFRFNGSDFAFSHFESFDVDGQITPNSILEDPLQCKGSSGSSNAGRASSRRAEDIEVPKRKKAGGLFPQVGLSLNNRRKGAPHRSPLS